MEGIGKPRVCPVALDHIWTLSFNVCRAISSALLCFPLHCFTLGVV